MPVTKTKAPRKQLKIAVPEPKVRKPASKRPSLRDVKNDEPTDPLLTPSLPHLTSTGIPGIFLNRDGKQVDSRGVLFNMGLAQKDEDALAFEILGETVDSPAKLLKRVALDPRLPLMMRVDAAKAAAPYYDKKTPVAIHNTNEDFTLDMTAIAKLPLAERRKLLDLLGTLGVNIGPQKR